MHHDICLIDYTINLIDKQNTQWKKKYTIEIVLFFLTNFCKYSMNFMISWNKGEYTII